VILVVVFFLNFHVVRHSAVRDIALHDFPTVDSREYRQ